MKEHVVLVFDVGTQSTRALLVTSTGKLLANCKKKYDKPYISLECDYAEQDADFYFDAMLAVAKECKRKYARDWKKIEAVTLTTFRDTIVCVDKNGHPLRKAILWLDKRLAHGKPKFTIFVDALLRAIGMKETVNLQFKKSHCNWIMQNEKMIWQKTHKLLLISGYLVFKLTGKFADSDASLVGHIPFDNKKRNWQTKFGLTYPVFPIPKEKLCEVVSAGDTFGFIKKEICKKFSLPENILLYAAGSDKACEVVGLGCIEEESAAISLGTAATINYLSHSYREPEHFIPPWPSVVKGAWNPELQIYRGYWLVSWFTKEFAEADEKRAKQKKCSVEELLDREIEKIEAGSGQLIFLPYFTPNVTQPESRGAWIGLTDEHRRAHLYRSVIEGINFALIDGMRTMEARRKKKFTSIALGGGGSQSDIVCQITADMFGLPVHRTQSFEAAGFGAAMTVFVGMNVFASWKEARDSMIKNEKPFLPNPANAARYRALYENIFRKAYASVYPLYKRMSN